MKVTIDRDGCIECGACERQCDAMFVVQPGEKAAIVEKYRAGSPAEGEVPDTLVDCVTDAESSCPVQVITTE